jgi:predicted TIM-barrel fold metal-dependent hydrolase
MLPLSPGRNAAGDKIHYNAPEMDALYGAAEAVGLPLAFHIGEAILSAAPGAAGISLITQMQGFRAQWGALTFGGAFDRFPRLKAVFVEAGLSWIPSMLHDADLAATHFANALRPALAHPPSWYWRAHCYATFMTDPTGLRLLEDIGPETALWSSDYPHQESTWGYTQSALQAVFDATDVETAQKIVGKTALELFRMDEPL